MKQILSSILSNSKEKIKNPFFGSFIISWIVINWQGLSYFFLANNRIDDKLLYVNENYSNIWLNLIIPIALALIYSLFFPWFFLKIEERTKNISEARYINSIAESNKLTFAKNEKVQRELELEEQKKNYGDLKSQNDLIENLKQENNELKKQISSYSKEVQELQAEKSKIINTKYQSGRNLYKVTFESKEDKEKKAGNLIIDLKELLPSAIWLEPEKDSDFIEFYSESFSSLEKSKISNLLNKYLVDITN